MNNLPPSSARQDWTSIFTIGGLIWLPAFVGLLFWSWSWWMPWPALSVHAEYWLNGLTSAVFDHTLQPWFEYWQALVNRDWHSAFIAHLVIAALMACVLAYFAARRFYVSGGKDGFRHISGPRLYRGNTALRHAKQSCKLEGGKRGLKLHPKLAITKKRESGNLLIIGNQGTGKTVVLSPMMHQVIERGERAFIYDEKREFTALFYQPQRSVLLAPWDTRSTQWNIQGDAYNASQAQLIAERLISESHDPLWSNGARMLFAGMIEILNHTQPRWGWRELTDMLSLDEATLQSQLQAHYPRAARFIVEGSKTTQSFFAQLLGALGWLYTLADAWPKAYENGFCVRHWVSDPQTNKPVIIVQADKRYKDIGAPLANTLIALMTSHILAQTNSAERELWLFIDELGNLPKNPALAEWMSLGRSKGCRIVAGTQSISQLKDTYGGQEAETLLNMFTMFVSMRVGAAGETATYTAKVFGERVVERPTSSAGKSNSTTLNWHRDTLPLVSASDIVHLPQASKKGVQGYVLIPGYKAVYRLRWPYAKLPMIAQEHCPAIWLSKGPALQTAQQTNSSQDTDRTDKPKATRVVDKLKTRRSAE
jgi:type IV secretory pathway TraG/TraD family ATPase VirD4